MARGVKLDNYALAAAPRLGWRGWLRWIWRQVTSMRVALILLLLLGLAAIPGSLLPQRPQNPAAVRDFLAEQGALATWLDRLGFFDVFGSPWFTAIYALLFASLIGCILPRSVAHARSLRAPVSAPPTSLGRYVHRGTVTVPDGPAALEQVAADLRGRGPTGAMAGYRVSLHRRPRRGGGQELALAAQTGHWRELGNLVFHTALVVVLLAVLAAYFLVYRGQAVVIEGRSFTNAVAAYDSFERGRGFDADRMEPFTVRLDALESRFDVEGRPLDFHALVTVTEADGEVRREGIRVNQPLDVGGTQVYLQGNGYAPDLTVVDSDGNVAFSGPVPFLPQDAVYTSTGVVKVPDVTSGDQIGLRGTLLPSAVIGEEGDAWSVRPEPLSPLLVLTVHRGDLGLDSGLPQNVYLLDDDRLDAVVDADGEPVLLLLEPGQTVDLPDGLGTITWQTLPRFVALDVRYDPTLGWLLGGALAVIAGLTVSLFSPQRRVWVVAGADGAATVVTAAAPGPDHDEALTALVERVLAAAGQTQQAEGEGR